MWFCFRFLFPSLETLFAWMCTVYFCWVFWNCFPQRLVMMTLRSWFGCAHEPCAVCSVPVHRDLGFLQVRGEGTSLSLLCSSGEGVLTVYFCVRSFALDFSFPEQSRHFSPAWPYEEVVYGCQWCVGKCHTQTGRCQWRAVFGGELALKASPLSHGPSCPVTLHISPLALPSCQRRAHLGKAALIRGS